MAVLFPKGGGAARDKSQVLPLLLSLSPVSPVPQYYLWGAGVFSISISEWYSKGFRISQLESVPDTCQCDRDAVSVEKKVSRMYLRGIYNIPYMLRYLS